MHDPLDTEYSILKQRLARRLEFEGHTNSTLGRLDLVELTKVTKGQAGVSQEGGKQGGRRGRVGA